jgi:transposase
VAAGLYNAHTLEVLFQDQFPIWLEASLHIKQAGGLQRGKSDSVDAQRIAEYAYRFRDRLRLWQPPRPVMKKLTELTRLRQRLQGMISQLKPGRGRGAPDQTKTLRRQKLDGSIRPALQ